MIKRKILADLEKELKSDKIIVLTGMRRVGKTTLIRYLYEQITDKRKAFLDLENPLNQSLFAEIDYEAVKKHLERLGLGRGKDLIVFLDEIQNVKNVPSVMKYLSDHWQIKFVVTGSASFYLKNLFSESLAGRKRIFELYPLDFEEFLSFKGPGLEKPSLTEKISQPTFNLFNKYVEEYLLYGGFPSVVLRESHEEKMAEIDDIFTSYFQKEIQVLSDFRKLDLARSVMMLLASRVGSKIDVSKIASELGSSRLTVAEYLDFLEGTYFLKRIKPFSFKADVSLRGQAKPYLVDVGLLSRFAHLPSSVIFENAVFNLLKKKAEISFYQSKGGAEIDFLLSAKRKIKACEVKLTANQVDINKLKRQAARLKINDYFLVAKNFSPLKKVVYFFQL